MASNAPAPQPTTQSDDPFALFETWYGEARTSEPNDSNAMALATSTPDGHPSLRMVLLKGHGADGFVFYTNFEGRKAGEILANPTSRCSSTGSRCAGRSASKAPRCRSTTPWPTPISPAARAIRSSAPGPATSRGRCRPRHVSRARFDEVAARYEGQDVPRPPHWSGFRVVPQAIEFWLDPPASPARAHPLRGRCAGGWRSGMLYP